VNEIPVIRSELGVNGSWHDFVTTPWYSTFQIHDSLIDEAKPGHSIASIVSFVAPDKITFSVENGKATYKLSDYDALKRQFTAYLVEGWTDPQIYAEWLASQEALAST
jgi:hypothetical protein